MAKGKISIMLKERKLPWLYSLCIKKSTFIPSDKEPSPGRTVRFIAQATAPSVGELPLSRLPVLMVGLVPHALWFQQPPRLILTAACPGGEDGVPFATSGSFAPLLELERESWELLYTGEKLGVRFHFLHESARTRFIFFLLVLVVRVACIRNSSDSPRHRGSGVMMAPPQQGA